MKKNDINNINNKMSHVVTMVLTKHLNEKEIPYCIKNIRKLDAEIKKTNYDDAIKYFEERREYYVNRLNNMLVENRFIKSILFNNITDEWYYIYKHRR